MASLDDFASPKYLEARDAVRKLADERVKSGAVTLLPERVPEAPFYNEGWSRARLGNKAIGAIVISSTIAGFGSINSCHADGTLRSVWGLDQKPMQVNNGDVVVLCDGILSVLSRSDAEDRISR